MKKIIIKRNRKNAQCLKGKTGIYCAIADIVSEASSVACWVYVQKYVKHKTLNEMLQELPDVGQFILAMDTWFEKLMEK